MTDLIYFDSRTEVFTYPDGITETLSEYQYRKQRFNYIQELQTALERMKVLYQNPGCMNHTDYEAAKREIQEAFDWWEMNVFVEFDDK
jgi:cell fate (sporulation/competence/biofilm development) regulator YmcA (YheA/YmcA/DUF963 family)